MYPAVVQVERVALCDDVLPLRFPITTVEGERLNSIRIKKDQVSLDRLDGSNVAQLTMTQRLSASMLSQSTATSRYGDRMLTSTVLNVG